jgi:hypothetical protein
MVLRILLIALATALASWPGAHAQIVADPQAPSGQRPTVLRAANGVTQVNVHPEVGLMGWWSHLLARTT